jgi:hypothetical protein
MNIAVLGSRTIHAASNGFSTASHHRAIQAAATRATSGIVAAGQWLRCRKRTGLCSVPCERKFPAAPSPAIAGIPSGRQITEVTHSLERQYSPQPRAIGGAALRTY